MSSAIGYPGLLHHTNASPGTDSRMLVGTLAWGSSSVNSDLRNNLPRGRIRIAGITNGWLYIGGLIHDVWWDDYKLKRVGLIFRSNSTTTYSPVSNMK